MRLFGLLKRAIGLAPIEASVEANDGETSPPDADHGAQDRERLFVASHFDNDRLTEAFTRWLVALHAKLKPEPYLLVGTEASAGNFRKWLKGNRKTPVLIVFYGHGERDGFLTHSKLGDRSNARYSYLCVADDFGKACDLLLIAYCCLAGNRLVHELSAKTLGRSISFRGEIGFVLGAIERENAFSGPVGETVVEAFRSGHIDELTLQELRDSYYQERRRWLPGGEYARDTRSLIVAMFLKQHASLLQVI
jgi:hypothetical protein